MNDKLNRIERFIESLPNDVETPEATSVLLPSAYGLMGGTANNKGDCRNADFVQCDKSKNGGSCINSIGKCGHSTNEGSCGFDDSHLTPVQPKP